jgi:hypothetical protein
VRSRCRPSLPYARARREVDDLPLGGHLDRHSLERRRLDDRREDALIQVLCQQKFSEAPF